METCHHALEIVLAVFFSSRYVGNISAIGIRDARAGMASSGLGSLVAPPIVKFGDNRNKSTECVKPNLFEWFTLRSILCRKDPLFVVGSDTSMHTILFAW